MKKIKKIINFLEKLVENFSMIVLISIVLVVFANVLSRALLNQSFQWSEELPLILLNWFTILGMAVAVGRKNHVAIEYFYSKAKFKSKVVLSFIVYLMSAIFGYILFHFGIFNITENLDVVMSATGLSQSIKYIMFPVSGTLMILYSTVDIINLFINKTIMKTMLEEDIREAEKIMEETLEKKISLKEGE